MAKEQKDSKTVEKLLDSLSRQVSDLHRETYKSYDSSDSLFGKATDELSDAIKVAINGDEDAANLSNISKLFEKLISKSSKSTNKLFDNLGKGNENDIASYFTNNDIMAGLMDTYSKTRWITELNTEFDIICKYMPKLQTALDIKRDCVLCSDSYTKEFLTIIARNETDNSSENKVIQANLKDLKKKYKLEDNAEKWYDDASKYGEEFVYCVPYKSALEELLKRKDNTGLVNESGGVLTHVDKTFKVKDILQEAYGKTSTTIASSNSLNEDGIVVRLQMDTSRICYDAVKESRFAAGFGLTGLSEAYTPKAGTTFAGHMNKTGEDTTLKFDNTITDEIKFEDDDKAAADGLSLTKETEKNPKVHVNGAVLHTVKNDKFIPIYIDEGFLGGYLIKFTNIEQIDSNASNTNVSGYSSLSSMFNAANGGKMGDNKEDINGDLLLKTISAKISKEIDSAFINANIDLKKEIYLILKYNDKYNQLNKSLDLNISFIPADDIHHLRFKEDSATHRGVSDLWDSLIPAKQWIMLTMTATLGTVTRGYDRRAYFVKQSLDTNTADSLLNVIATIKKGNFGIRQMESINNILGMLGRFNDFVIPVGPNGDSPIQFETMQGQQFETPDNLMNNLEEEAVNATDVPIEIVNSSQSMDFAIRYTMTNAKLLRAVLKRQAKVEEFLSEIVTKLYKFEYDENVDLEVTLPPPAFLTMTQGTNLIQAANTYADAIAEIEMAGKSDDEKILFKRRVIRKMAPAYLSDDELDDIKNKVIIDISKKSTLDIESYE